MGDNTTSSPAAEYDAHIGTVNPNYRSFHIEALSLVAAAVPVPGQWLDTGCGTGTLAVEALGRFPETKFVLADPSAEMLSVAKEKLSGAGQGRVSFIQAGTRELELPDCSLDVITAMLSHHYFHPEERKAATDHCFRMLKPGGVYVTFEHIRPNSEEGLRLSLKRWGDFQLGMGREADTISRHLARFDREYFPITVEQHLNLLRSAGFNAVEMLYFGYMQAGFYAIK